MYTLNRLSLVDMIELSARHYSSRPALSLVGGDRHTYAQVEKLTRRLGTVLRSHGIEKGDKVTLLAENSPQWGIAYLSIIRIGAIVVPILTDFTSDQIINIIEHSESKAVLCSEKLMHKIKSGTGNYLKLDIGTGEIRGKSHVSRQETSLDDAAIEAFTPAVSDPDDLAMIVYTSGTTGLSKGVMLSHSNILSNALACRSIIVLHRLDRLLSILPLAHTYEFTIGFVIPFMAGSHIHYLDRPPSATALLPALKAVRPTIMLSVPLVIEKIYRSNIKPTLEGMKLYASPLFKPILIKFAGMKLKKTFGSHLRFFGIGGAPLSADVEEFLKTSGFPYAIGYGLTETSPLLAGCSPAKTHIRSTGPALKGVSLRIQEGEIQAKGANVFKGYYKDESRTRESFTQDGWFRTGDLGSIDSRKRLFVRGRLKTMILGASGENIYPEEVEAVINQSPFVAESLVVEGESGLTAYVYLKSEVLENIEARLQDGLEAAESMSSKVGSVIGHAIGDAEKAAGKLLETIRKEANEKLASFSRIRAIELREEPFEKTPTQKIKRFLYPGKK